MKMVLQGNFAVAYSVKFARAQVIAAYPITPQTQIVEKLSELCGNKELNAKFIKVESEHSALAAVISSSMAGARSFTATSSQGLLLMHELLHWASGARVPLVLANVNRSVAPGWNIWADHTDSLSQRDTGWIQIYPNSNQEVFYTILEAFRLAETVNIPCMVNLDAFYLSHTCESVEFPPQELVDEFLPPYSREDILDVDAPKSFFPLTNSHDYRSLRYDLHQTIKSCVQAFKDVEEEFKSIWKTPTGVIELYKMDDAKVCIISMGTTFGSTMYASDSLRDDGIKAGALRIRMYNPLPKEDMSKAISSCTHIIIVDRDLSPGNGGIVYQTIKSALSDVLKDKKVFSVIAGVGGGDITPGMIVEATKSAVNGKINEGMELWCDIKR